MLPMLTIVCGCNPDNIIYKCTKLHDHSSNKIEIFSAPRHILDVQEGGAFPLTFSKMKIIFFL